MTPMQVIARACELAQRGIPPYRFRGFDVATNGHMLLAAECSLSPADAIPAHLEAATRDIFDTETPIAMPLRGLLNLKPLYIDECPCEGGSVHLEWDEIPCPFCDGDGEIIRPNAGHVVAIDGAYFDRRYMALAARHLNRVKLSAGLGDLAPAERSAASSTQPLVMRSFSGTRLAAVMPVNAQPRPDGPELVVLTIEGEGLA